MKYVMKKYQDGDLNLNDSTVTEFNRDIETYHKKRRSVINKFFAPTKENLSYT